jgi:hypothetical protein
MTDEETIHALTDELDKLMLDAIERGLPGLHALTAAHGHLAGRIAAVCGRDNAAAFLRATARRVERLPAQTNPPGEAQDLARLKPAGRA